MVLKKNLKKKKQVKKTTVDDLAITIGSGFEHVDKRFEQVDMRLNSLERGQEEMKRENTLEHDEIKVRLDNVAYRFELVELQKRGEVLERRAMV